MSSITRRNFLKTASLTAAGLAGGAQGIPSSAAQPKKPNIIFIMADDLGYGDLGCYGQKTIRTPNIDRMAKEGMRFTQCYAGSTVCAPSRCCLMTGYHSGHAHIRGNKRHPLLPEHVTVAETLKDAGYETGIIGKWGLGEPDTSGVPNRQGFDYWYGYLNQGRAHNYYPDFLWRNEERAFFKRWTYSHDAFTKEALNFIRERKEKPFFLYLPYTIPHAFNEGGINGMSIPSDKPYTKEDWPQQQKNHAAMITRMDTDVGKIFALLKELEIDENTIVFFTSDNGPHREGGADPDFFDSNGPLRGIKRDLYEGGIRVPMIVRWPGKIEAGSTSDQIWAFWDFPSTAAELAGTFVSKGIDGISMVNALTSKPQQDHDYLYWEFHERETSRAIRKGDWKAIRLGWNAKQELYNLKDDPSETTDVSKTHPEIVKAMNGLFDRARTNNEFYPVDEKVLVDRYNKRYRNRK